MPLTVALNIVLHGTKSFVSVYCIDDISSARLSKLKIRGVRRGNGLGS